MKKLIIIPAYMRLKMDMTWLYKLMEMDNMMFRF